MSRKINLRKTLSEIKKLPLEVSQEQVKQWVDAYTENKKTPKSRLSYWLAKIISRGPFN